MTEPKIVYHLYFNVPVAVNEKQEVHFRKNCTLPFPPPIGTKVEVLNPDGSYRFYEVRGYFHSEVDSSEWSDFIVRLYENEDNEEEPLDTQFNNRTEGTAVRAWNHIAHLRANGWEQQPDML